MKIVVMGGSGLIGRQVVANLDARGHQAVAASPSTGVNAFTGEGLAGVLAGAQVVVDVVNAPSWEPDAVLEFFTRSGENLLAAARAAGVGHHVALSIVGTDKLPDNGYFRAKVAQEALIKASGLAYSIVRATQFFEFVATIAQAMADEAGIRVPDADFQPIAAADVATILADVALGAPLNGTLDIAGPERGPFAAFVARQAAATGDVRPISVDPAARYFGGRLEKGSLVPADAARLAPLRFEDWLAR